MMFDHIVDFFMPAALRDNKTALRYEEYRVVISSVLIGIPLVLLFPAVLWFLHKPVLGFLLNAFLLTLTLFSVKFFHHYRVPMGITALVTYFIIYGWVKESGLIFSPSICILHMYLLSALWADKKNGWWAIVTNLLLFVFIYYQTVSVNALSSVGHILGSPLYALLLNCLITLFFGGFLAWQQYDQEKNREIIRQLQDQRITMLDYAVKMRTEQLNNIRETIATDFHDQTGNMLSAITRQASLLKHKLNTNKEVQPMVSSIIDNSNELYASSKDFLWHLNHDSDDPEELFDYLTSYGQQYYNQFDIAFSSVKQDCSGLQLEPSAALNLIFIFKEVMTNVVKHAGADEVELAFTCKTDYVTYTLKDNGLWKAADLASSHYGITNMERRSQKNNFIFSIDNKSAGTSIAVKVPVKRANQL